MRFFSTPERQRCPRRDEGYGYDKSPTADSWRPRNWGLTWARHLAYWWNNGLVGIALRRLQNTLWQREWHRLRGWLPNPPQGGTTWEWPWQPRTCSFCGGVHPEDAARLVMEGWDAGVTDKDYKWYLEPPGTRERYIRAMKALRSEVRADPAHKEERPGWAAVPPVKLYLQHFSTEQITKLNAALATQKDRPHEA